MQQNDSEIIAKLAPPGEGIPFPAKLFLQYYVAPFVAAKTPWHVSKIRFLKVTEKILTEIAGLSEIQLTQKVLIKPLRGLEDSSRYWSIAMTLEHLCIVAEKFCEIIPELAENKLPNYVADTATVKPLGQENPEVIIHRFKIKLQKSFDAIDIEKINKTSTAKFKHPWFGPMTAKQWYWLLPVHHNLHLEQIKEIKKGL